MHISFESEPWLVDKDLGQYDAFTLDFIRRLPTDVPYVLVSGYPALLFGRTRNTEDIDMLVDPMEESAFGGLWSRLEGDHECINTSDPSDAYHQYLLTGVAIRFARKHTIEPNMEFKFIKNDVERYALQHRKEVLLNGSSIWVSPMELQVAFKLYLGGDKDLEDARHLYDLAKSILDLEELRQWIGRLEVPAATMQRSRLEVDP